MLGFNLIAILAGTIIIIILIILIIRENAKKSKSRDKAKADIEALRKMELERKAIALEMLRKKQK